jgi:hypothetical protein
MIASLPGRRSALGVIAALAAVALVLPVGADAQTAAAGKGSADSQLTTVQVAGQTVAVDRATGKLRQPTPEEAKALAAGLQKLINRSTQGLQVVHHPNGAMSIDLQGRFQSVAVAKVNSDGKVAQSCATNMNEATAFVQSNSNAVSPSTKKKAADKAEEEK